MTKTNLIQAIVDGEPPNLPEEGFTPAAHNFVRGCLHKVPKLRPSYAMLLEHPWISDLIKPSTISEEDEEAEEIDFEAPRVATVGDVEVGEWVIGAMELRRVRIEEGIMGPVKPALHAAPLDTVPNPVSGLTDGVAALIT